MTAEKHKKTHTHARHGKARAGEQHMEEHKDPVIRPLLHLTNTHNGLNLYVDPHSVTGIEETATGSRVYHAGGFWDVNEEATEILCLPDDDEHKDHP